MDQLKNNKTKKYCNIALILYGVEYVTNLLKLDVVGSAIDDDNLRYPHLRDSIYLVLNEEGCDKEGLDYVTSHKSFEYSYELDGNLILIINLPEECIRTIYYFRKSRYSFMYSPHQKARMGLTPSRKVFKVLNKSESLRREIEKTTGVSIPESSELDELVDLSKEILNYDPTRNTINSLRQDVTKISLKSEGK